jgi:hypothetical protein
MIVGVHLRNEQRLTTDDRRLFDLARFGGALAMHYHDPAEVLSIGIGAASCVVRLRDTIYKDPSGAEFIPSAGVYALDCIADILRFYPAGFRRFVLDNEPNYSWSRHKRTGWDWQATMRDILRTIRTMIGTRFPGIQFGLTAFARGGDRDRVTNDWYTAVTTRIDGAPSLVEQFDFLTSHCYWQASGDMRAEQFGAQYIRVAALAPGKPVYITESGNSSRDLPIKPEAAVLQRIYADQYPAYCYQIARVPAVRAVYFYILGSTPDWTDYNLGDVPCAALGERCGK